MHPDDLAVARQRLNQSWIPHEERFSTVQTDGRHLDPSKASPPPPERREPLTVRVDRHYREVMASRKKEVPIEELCPISGNAHRWNKWGRKNKKAKWRKRCRDCHKIAGGLSQSEYAKVEKNGGKHQRGEA